MAEIKMTFPQGKGKALTLSYDDGVEQDIRLIEIMKKNGLKGTFNLNSGLYKDPKTVYEKGTVHRRMSKAEATDLYTKNGMEVAVHGLHHLHMEQLPFGQCVYETMKDRENLEEQFGVIVRGMAYPFGTYSDQAVEALKMAQIAYARTVISSGRFDIPTDWLRLPATCHHNDSRLMELAKNFAEDNPAAYGNARLFYLWGHSYEFEGCDNWHVIEEFAEYMGGREDIWYATNLEIHDYVENYRHLIFSADGEKIYNPGSLDIYLTVNGKLRCVSAGETIGSGEV